MAPRVEVVRAQISYFLLLMGSVNQSQAVPLWRVNKCSQKRKRGTHPKTLLPFTPTKDVVIQHIQTKIQKSKRKYTPINIQEDLIRWVHTIVTEMQNPEFMEALALGEVSLIRVGSYLMRLP